MNEPDYKHVLFKDLRDYLKSKDYLGGFTATEQAYIRKNIGAVGVKDIDRITMFPETVSYSDLQVLIARNQLVPGAVYTIENFQSIYQSNEKVNDKYITYGKNKYPSTIYTLITIAASANKLFSNIMILEHPDWIVQYDSTSITLDDGETTMGQITYLQDDNFNRASYDFKNIRIKMDDKVYYTFSNLDGTDNSNNCYNNDLTFSKNNILIGDCFNNIIYESNNFFATPVANMVCSFKGLIVNKEGFNNETLKSSVKFDGKWYIDYLDLETLTHQFYELANNSSISQ